MQDDYNRFIRRSVMQAQCDYEDIFAADAEEASCGCMGTMGDSDRKASCGCEKKPAGHGIRGNADLRQDLQRSGGLVPGDAFPGAG